MDRPASVSPNKRTPASNGKKKSLSSTQPASSFPGTTSPSSTPGFNFINVDPSSRTESSSSRTLIRANAGRYIWKRRKASSSKESSSRAKPYDKPSSQHNATTVKTEPSSPPEDDDQVLENLPRVKEEDGEEYEERGITVTKAHASGLGPRRRTTRRLDLTSGLSHGLRSPLFTSFGTEVPEDIVRRTFKYCELFPFAPPSKYTLLNMPKTPSKLTKSSRLCGHVKNAPSRCRWSSVQGI